MYVICVVVVVFVGMFKLVQNIIWKYSNDHVHGLGFRFSFFFCSFHATEILIRSTQFLFFDFNFRLPNCRCEWISFDLICLLVSSTISDNFKSFFCLALWFSPCKIINLPFNISTTRDPVRSVFFSRNIFFFWRWINTRMPTSIRNLIERWKSRIKLYSKLVFS